MDPRTAISSRGASRSSFQLDGDLIQPYSQNPNSMVSLLGPNASRTYAKAENALGFAFGELQKNSVQLDARRIWCTEMHEEIRKISKANMVRIDRLYELYEQRYTEELRTEIESKIEILKDVNQLARDNFKDQIELAKNVDEQLFEPIGRQVTAAIAVAGHYLKLFDQALDIAIKNDCHVRKGENEMFEARLKAQTQYFSQMMEEKEFEANQIQAEWERIHQRELFDYQCRKDMADLDLTKLKIQNEAKKIDNEREKNEGQKQVDLQRTNNERTVGLQQARAMGKRDKGGKCIIS